nr:uncharacterized protein DDB_G0271670-like [Cherax quadricarinatus]
MLQGKCQQQDLCLTQECVHAASSLLAALNNKVDPCHDFYEYACGGWIQANIHKADANTLFYGINHNILPEYIDTKLSQLLKTGEGVPEELLQTKPYRDLFFFYQSCLDVADEQEADLKPVFDMLKSKAEFQVGRPFQPESWNLTRALLEMFRMNGAPLFDVIIDADIRNSSRFSIIITSPRRSGLVPALVRPFRRRSRGLPGLQQFLRERGQRVLFGGTSDEAAVLEMLVGRNANTKREAAFFEPGAAAGAAVGVGASAADDAVAEALHRNNSALTGNDNVYPVINIVPTRQVFTGEDAKQPDERHVDGEYVDGQHYNAKQHAEENVGDKNNGDNISMLLLPDKFSNITKATVQIYSATPVTTLGSTTIHSNSTQIPSTTPAPTLRSSDAHSLIQTPTSTPIPAQGLTTTNITTHSSNQMHTTTATIPAPIQRSATTHSPTQTTTTTPSTTTAHEPTQATTTSSSSTTTTSSSSTSTTSSSSHDQDATTTPPGETDMNIIESEDYRGLDDAVEDDQNFLVSRKEIYRMFKVSPSSVSLTTSTSVKEHEQQIVKVLQLEDCVRVLSSELSVSCSCNTL